METHLAARAAIVLRDGRRTLDTVALRWGCPACGAEEWSGPLLQNPDAPSPDLVAGLVAGLTSLSVAPPRCACGAARELRAAARHVHHGDRGLDLVVSKEGALTWWDPRTGASTPLEALAPADAKALARDGLLRHLDGRLAVADGQGFCEALLRGATEHAGDAHLLALVEAAARYGEAGRAVADALLTAHRDAPRADPAAARRAAVEAHLAAARLEVEGARSGQDGPDALERARAALDEALALDPDQVDAALLRATVLRALGGHDAARDALEALVVRQPGCAQALVALGQLLLELGEAEPARARFAAVRGDADAALGEARALLRLGRLDEAAAAAERGRALDAEHPRLGPVEHELARRLGREPGDGERVLVDVVGLDVFGEAALERGVQRLVELGHGSEEGLSEGTETERQRLAAWDLCCKLRIVDGQALVRALDGRPARLWRVEGDGRCCTVTLHDDPDALADFAGEFDALWAEDAR